MKCFIALCTVSFAGICHSQTTTGNELHRWLLNPDSEVGISYVMAVLETEVALTGGMVFCPPKGATKAQTWDVVKKYLIDKPEERHKPAPSLVLTAVNKAFPCGKP